MKARGLSVLALALSGCATAPRPLVLVPPVASVPPGMQFLYGSAESAALSEQAYNVLVDHVRLFVGSRKATPGPRTSVVLAPAATLEQPATVPCGDKPLAAVFDMDETAVLNLGYEYNDARTGGAYDPARWARWERTGADKVVAVPGAVAAFIEIRRLGVTVVINTNRNADSAGETERALAVADLGRFTHGETLFLKGDVDGKSGKDGRRAAIAARYCVVAMGGDQLGDFSDLFMGAPTVRRAAAASPAMRGFFGRFWFMLPNPVYGTALAGGWDDVFPADKRWADAPATGVK